MHQERGAAAALDERDPSPEELVNRAIAAFNQRNVAAYTAAVAVQVAHDGPMPMPDGSVVEPTGGGSLDLVGCRRPPECYTS